MGPQPLCGPQAISHLPGRHGLLSHPLESLLPWALLLTLKWKPLSSPTAFSPLSSLSASTPLSSPSAFSPLSSHSAPEPDFDMETPAFTALRRQKHYSPCMCGSPSQTAMGLSKLVMPRREVTLEQGGSLMRLDRAGPGWARLGFFRRMQK